MRLKSMSEIFVATLNWQMVPISVEIPSSRVQWKPQVPHGPALKDADLHCRPG